jgi:hypothetical protein
MLYSHSIKKKYIEPYEKLLKAVQNKHNIDITIALYDKVKSFKSNVKYLRFYYEKDNFMSDSGSYITYYQNIKKALNDINGVSYIKEEVEWFKSNEDKIMSSFRIKFQEAIRSMVTIL